MPKNYCEVERNKIGIVIAALAAIAIAFYKQDYGFQANSFSAFGYSIYTGVKRL